MIIVVIVIIILTIILSILEWTVASFFHFPLSFITSYSHNHTYIHKKVEYTHITTISVSIIDYGMYKVTERIALACLGLSFTFSPSLLPTIMITSIHHHSRPCPTTRRRKKELFHSSPLFYFYCCYFSWNWTSWTISLGEKRTKSENRLPRSLRIKKDKRERERE